VIVFYAESASLGGGGLGRGKTTVRVKKWAKELKRVMSGIKIHGGWGSAINHLGVGGVWRGGGGWGGGGGWVCGGGVRGGGG